LGVKCRTLERGDPIGPLQRESACANVTEMGYRESH